MQTDIGLRHTERSTFVDLCLRKPIPAPNEYDACLCQDALLWDSIVSHGGLHRLCCPKGHRSYLQRPWIAMPKEGRRFKPIATLDVPAPTFTGLDLVVMNVLVPAGYDGVITDIVCEFTGTGFVEGSGDLVWRLSADGRFLRDLGNLTVTIGSLITPSPVPRGGLRVYSHDQLIFSVAFAVGAEARLDPNGKVICSITGWFYPR